MEFPEDLRYTKEHEWVRLEGTRVRKRLPARAPRRSASPPTGAAAPLGGGA